VVSQRNQSLDLLAIQALDPSFPGFLLEMRVVFGSNGVPHEGRNDVTAPPRGLAHRKPIISPAEA